VGNSNPIKQITDAATDIVSAPIRETSRTLGLDGVVNAAEDFKRFGTTSAEMIAGEITGDNKKKKEEAAAEEATKKAAEDNATNLQNEADAKKKKDEATAEIEKERMAAGSKSRTLLTGPRGLEEEDGQRISASRRTLRAR
jgi:hypothetical protein